jgi:serine/threonine-protein kinase
VSSSEELSKAVDAWPTGTLLADKFRVVRVIGSGGMGVVYEVIHELTRHRRALKTLNAKSKEQPQAVERFLREASAAGRIGSPHIVETYDAGTLDSGEPYLVMELLEGETLEGRLTRKGRFDPEEIVAIFAQAAEGAHAAHEAGIIHRDLKPENLFLAKTKDGMRVKLLDFGVSIFDERHRLERATQEGTLLGTPFYMSPEQVRGETKLDGRSDVYALGVMMHECATGAHPYPAETLHGVIANVIEKKPAPLVEVVPGFPASLAAVTHRALEKNVDLRLPSARALAEALAAVAIELGVPGVTLAPASAAAAASWIAAVPSQRAPMSAVGAHSVPPPRVTSGAATPDPGDVEAPPPQRSLMLSAAGAVLGAGIVGVILFTLLGRAKPDRGDAARSEASATASASASAKSAAVEPAGSAPAATASAAAVAPSASTSADVAAPSASARAPKHGPKPRDLAGKGEFKP